MITAKEAREKSKAKLNEIIEEQKQAIEKLILEACEEGEFYIIYPKKMADEVEEWLLELGYNIEEEETEEFLIEWEFLEDEALNNSEEVVSQEEQQEENDGVEEDFDVEGAEEPVEENAGVEEEVFFDDELAEEGEKATIEEATAEKAEEEVVSEEVQESTEGEASIANSVDEAVEETAENQEEVATVAEDDNDDDDDGK